MIDIDAFMADAVTRDTIPDLSPNEHYGTRGGLEWGDAPFRLRSGHVVDFKGSTLELDVDRVTDEMLKSQNPINMIPPQIGNLYGKPPLEAWAAVLTHQRVKNVRLVANFSKLAKRVKDLGVPSLRITGCGLLGHDAQLDNIELSDFGAYGYENFPLWIAGTNSAYDHNALYCLDDSYVYDEAGTVSSINNTRFVDYVPEASNNQVTVRMITGSTCAAKLVENPWGEFAPWRQLMRRDLAFLDNVTTCPPDVPNIVQGITGYQCLKGLVSRNKSTGASIGYYSDYCRNKGIHITADNSFTGGVWGAIIRLSPSAAGTPDLELQFSSEDFVIENFTTDAGAGAVYLNQDPLPDGSFPASRYVRNIAIDERLKPRVVNVGDRAGVVWIPSPQTKRRGCL